MSHPLVAPATTQPAATQSPRAGCAYLVAAVATGTAAAMAWIYDAAFHAPVNHGLCVGAAIIATIAGCRHIVRNSETRRQYQIEEARAEGFDRGYVSGVERALNSGPGEPRLRSVT